MWYYIYNILNISLLQPVIYSILNTLHISWPFSSHDMYRVSLSSIQVMCHSLYDNLKFCTHLPLHSFNSLLHLKSTVQVSTLWARFPSPSWQLYKVISWYYITFLFIWYRHSYGVRSLLPNRWFRVYYHCDTLSMCLLF